MAGLEGFPLRYLVDTNEVTFDEDTVTVVGYDYNKNLPKGMIVAKQTSIIDHKDTSNYAPYINQKVPDPKGPGFWRNLHDQLEHAQKGGYKLIVWDHFTNPSFQFFELKRTIDVSFVYKLGVLLKDIDQLQLEERVELIKHINVYGIISEVGTPETLNQLRVDAGKPDLPIWVVTKQLTWANQVVETSGNYYNIGVTYSSTNRYDTSIDILKPKARVDA